MINTIGDLKEDTLVEQTVNNVNSGCSVNGAIKFFNTAGLG